MRELIEAAKAVIERWDRSTWKTMPNMDEYICQLRAAVKQAESDKVDRDDELFAACMYGAKTERERIKAIILGMDKTLGITWTPEWRQCINVMMEKIYE